MKEKFSIISALVVSSIVLMSLKQVYGQENEVIVTIVKGSADAGSGKINMVIILVMVLIHLS